MEHQILFSYNNLAEHFTLPVLPAKIQVKEKGNNKSFDLNTIGEATVIKAGKGLVINLESFFPLKMAPYVSAKELKTPMWYVATLKRWRDSGHPMRVTLVNTAITDSECLEKPFTMACTIENFEYEERAGEPGDIHYKLELKEYRFRTIQKVEKITMEDGTVVQRVKSKRVDERIKPDHYVVKEDGEDFWGICKRHFNEDGHTKEVQKKNGLPIPVVLKAGQVIQF